MKQIKTNIIMEPMTPKFFYSIKFKLTLIFSLLIFIIIGFIFVIFNLLVANSLRQEPNLRPILTNNAQINRKFRELAQEEQERITAVRENDITRIRTISIYLQLPVLFASILVAYFSVSYFIAPVEAINKELNRVGAKSLNRRLKQRRNDDEFDILIENYNNMLDRLESVFSAQSEFIHNAAHELKTPLTIMKLNIEHLLDETEKLHENSEELMDIRSSIEKMNSLITDLLLLANNHTVEIQDKIMVKELLSKLTEQYSELEKKKKIKIILKIEPELENTEILINKGLFSRGVENIVDNAFKFTKTKIEISLKEIDGQPEIWISDDGEGIPETKLNKIFDRFFQADKSRSSSGYGLGLAIAKKLLTEIHNFQLKVSSEKSSGTTFKIRLT